MSQYCSHCMEPRHETGKVCPACGTRYDGAVPAHHLLPGTILNGKFYVGEALGEGGFGITYIGRDLKLNMKVAIKEFYPNGYVSRSNTTSAWVNDSVTEGRRDFFTKGRERFLNEARILAKFSGEPGIVDVRDYFEENNTAYIIMEYLDGVDLKTYLQQHGKLAPEQAVQLLMPVMHSLEKVHSQGLIHRDISPDNIMLVKDHVKLLDFGAARAVSAEENRSLSVMLKPGYAPEEQYRSKGNQGPWTDVYALCATIYKCITGVTPDDATQRVYQDEVKPPSALGVAIQPSLEQAIMQGMRVNQQDRFQSVEILIQALSGGSAAGPMSQSMVGGQPTMYGGTGNTYPNPNAPYPTTGTPQPSYPTTGTPQPSYPTTGTPQPSYPTTGTPPYPAYPPQGTTVPLASNVPDPTAKGKNKNKLVLIVIGAVAVLAIVIVLVVLLTKGDDADKSDKAASSSSESAQSVDEESSEAEETPEATEAPAETPETTTALETTTEVVTTTEAPQAAAELSDNLLDFTFQLEGDVYQLPCTLTDFTDNGWTISSTGTSSETQIDGESYNLVTLARDGKRVMVAFYNLSGNARTLQECKIGGIEVNGYDGLDFTIAQGITLNSGSEAIKEAFGSPGESNKHDDYESLIYYTEEESYYKRVTFKCYLDAEDAADYNSIELRNFVATADDVTETNEERPSYLDDYQAPTERGDILSGVVEIEGDLYQMPAPLSVFLDNGWEITDRPGSVTAGSDEYIDLERGGKKLSWVTITNFADYQTTPENCVVTSVSVDGDNEDYPNLSISSADAPIVIGSARDEVVAQTEDIFNISTQTDYFAYSYYGYLKDEDGRDIDIYIYVDSETELVEQISVQYAEWPY